MVKIFLTITTSLLSMLTIAGDDGCNFKANEFYSTYEVFDALKIKGGITTDKDAQQNIGKMYSINDKLYSSFFMEFEPIRVIEACQSVGIEGEVLDPGIGSYFYGNSKDRKIVNKINFFHPEYPNDPMISIEVINENELWETYDGWLYKLKRVD